MSNKVAIVCITKNGINISKRIKEKIPLASIYALSKHKDSSQMGLSGLKKIQKS